MLNHTLKRSLIWSFSMVIILTGYGVLAVQAQDNRLIIHADEGEHTISKHIYGHFAEHLGRCIYGGFYVGEDNTQIPHTNGIRNDVVDALRALRIPNLRWPGGCFADTYQWKDGVGLKAERPTIINRWWGGVTEDNSFGTHDFLNLCEMLETEPYLAANVGSGTVQNLSDWVEYVNHDGKGPMAAWRRENGREQPWDVQYWGVGNEMWGCGGNMTAEYYANVYRQYATLMPNVGGRRLYRIASGASEDDHHWTEVMMRDIPHHLLEGVALHSYSVIDWRDKGSATEFSISDYFKTMEVALKMEDRVTRHSTIMDKYDPDKKVGLIVDEWGGWYDVEPGTNPGFLYQQNTMRDAMIAGTTLNIFNNHCDRVRMANLAQTINVLQAVLLTQDEKLVLTPTYHVMRMYNVHQDGTMLPAFLKTKNFDLEEGSLPALSASSSMDAAGKVHISLVNIHPTDTQTVPVSVRGKSFTTVTGEILSSERLQDHNTFDQPDQIKPDDFNGWSLDGENIMLTIPPFSVVVLTLE